MKEKIAVIGSNSFSGAHFVDYALDKGAETIGISRSPEPNPVFLPYKRKPASSFRFYQLDLNHDLDEIMKNRTGFPAGLCCQFCRPKHGR